MLACDNKNEEAAALLMETTKNIGALHVQDTEYKRSALHYASSSGLESIVAKLLSLGADVALKDKEGNTSVWLEMEREHEAAVEVLLQAIMAAGMDIDARYEGNAQGKQGQTLLMLAIACSPPCLWRQRRRRAR